MSGSCCDAGRRPQAVSFTTAPGDQLLEFDLAVHGGDGTEQLDLGSGRRRRIPLPARFPVPSAGRYVMLADGRPGEHLLTARLTNRRPPGGRRAEDRLVRTPPEGGAEVPAGAVGPTTDAAGGRSHGAAGGPRAEGGDPRASAHVRIFGLRLVNQPGAGASFSPMRTVGAAFVAGAASGSLTTLVTLVATGWTAKKVLAALTRRRSAGPRDGRRGSVTA